MKLGLGLVLFIVLCFQACASIDETDAPRVGRSPASTPFAANSVLYNTFNPKEKFANDEITKFREQLPLKVDDYMSIVFVTYANDTLFIVQKRNDYMGPRRFTMGVRYSHDKSVQHVCESKLLKRFLERGIAIQYNYIGVDDAPLAQEIFYPAECKKEKAANISREDVLAAALSKFGN